MNYLALLRLWPAIPIILTVVFFLNWQAAREEVGKVKESRATWITSYKALEANLAKANAQLDSVAQQGAVSLGRCQELVASDSAKSFDLGVEFGKSTCAKPLSSFSR